MKERPQCCGECVHCILKPNDRNYCTYLRTIVREKEKPCDAGWRKEEQSSNDKKI